MDKGVEALTPVCVPKRIVRNWAASVMRHCDYCGHYEDTVLNDDGSAICASCCDSEHSGNMQCALEEALQRNSELIAALEQAQQESKELQVQVAAMEGAALAMRDDMREARSEIESSPNSVMQLSNELADMKRKCAEFENQKFDTAKLINKFYTRYPLESFKSDPERAETLGYYMAGAEVQHFGDFVVYEMPEDDEGSE